jgi:hypothetical protein
MSIVKWPFKKLIKKWNTVTEKGIKFKKALRHLYLDQNALLLYAVITAYICLDSEEHTFLNLQ